MTWETLFLGCFAFGFVLSLVAFLAGSSHLHLHAHHGHFHAHGHHGSGVAKFNFGTITLRLKEMVVPTSAPASGATPTP